MKNQQLNNPKLPGSSTAPTKRWQRIFCLVVTLLAAGSARAQDIAAASKVVSCAIEFANNSIEFDEDYMRQCLQQVDPGRVTYVHVFATASSPGSVEHNLALSQVRAEKVAHFVSKIKPKLPQIHAFGGGENPRFGRQARIFVVIGPKRFKNAKPETVVKVEEVEKVVTKQEFIEKDILISFGVGSGAVSEGSGEFGNHNQVSLGLRVKDPRWELFGKNIYVGALLGNFNHTKKRDFTSFMPLMGTEWRLTSLTRQRHLVYDTALAWGLLSNQEKLTSDGGFHHGLHLVDDEYQVRFGAELGHMYQSRYQAISLGVQF